MTVMAAQDKGDVCYVKRNHQLLWQQMRAPDKLGNKCKMYNANFVPVYMGYVGKCIPRVTCGAEPGNVNIGRYP